MTRKTLFTASLLVPLITLSGVAYAGPQWIPTMAPWKPAVSLSQTGPSVTSKPYAQYVAPQPKYHWTGPKHNQYHRQGR